LTISYIHDIIEQKLKNLDKKETIMKEIEVHFVNGKFRARFVSKKGIHILMGWGVTSDEAVGNLISGHEKFFRVKIEQKGKG